MQDIFRYGGIGLLVYAVARYLQNGYGLDLNAILAGSGGGVSLVAGYYNTLKPFFLSKKDVTTTDVATKLNDAELVDYESMRHLSSRFGKINDTEALELLRKLNDKLFKLHHPETKNETTVNS